MALTITSANSVFMLSIAGIFSTPQRLQGYGVDAAFATEGVDLGEVQMGVDGRMSAGFTPNPQRQTVTLQADSVSNALFDTWAQAMRTAREMYPANGTLTIPSIGKKYALTRGFLTNYQTIPDAKKVLQPRAFILTWEDISPAAY